MDLAETQADVQPDVDAPPAPNTSSRPKGDQGEKAVDTVPASKVNAAVSVDARQSCDAAPARGAASPVSKPSSGQSNPAKRPVPPSPLKPVNKDAKVLAMDAKAVAASPDAGPPLKRPRAVGSPARERTSREGNASPAKTPTDLMEKLKEYVQLCGGSLEDGWSVDVRVLLTLQLTQSTPPTQQEQHAVLQTPELQQVSLGHVTERLWHARCRCSTSHAGPAAEDWQHCRHQRCLLQDS